MLYIMASSLVLFFAACKKHQFIPVFTTLSYRHGVNIINVTTMRHKRRETRLLKHIILFKFSIMRITSKVCNKHSIRCYINLLAKFVSATIELYGIRGKGKALRKTNHHALIQNSPHTRSIPQQRKIKRTPQRLHNRAQ